MLNQPLKGNELVPETETEEKRSPRHSICLSLVLAVIAHCCCMGLGIIPLIMVMLAYVKRETGKYEDARRLNKYSKDVSAVLVIFFIILLCFAFIYFVCIGIHNGKSQQNVLAPNDRGMAPFEDRIDDGYHTDEYSDSVEGMYEEEYSDINNQYQTFGEDQPY